MMKLDLSDIIRQLGISSVKFNAWKDAELDVEAGPRETEGQAFAISMDEETCEGNADQIPDEHPADPGRSLAQRLRLP
ncbi:hypothetical protein [Paenibacillus sp. UNC496MF]|uniref:hypothetical protein n=1 Tax=Paenibacillus sp. UNC496MF TaxID=1502753 RepID=UPI001160A8AA|nr:hypothetical protein [Paenibacillus sp. UNC496MF]